MRETFASHGSNPSKAKPFRADPRLDGNRRLIAHPIPIAQFGNTELRPSSLRSFKATESGCTERQVSLVHCNSQVEVVPPTFLAFPGQTDVGISETLHLGLGFFGHPNAAPALPALRLGWSRTSRGPGSQLFHVLHSTPEDLGPPLQATTEITNFIVFTAAPRPGCEAVCHRKSCHRR